MLKEEARKERVPSLSRADSIGRVVYAMQLADVNPLDPDAVKQINAFVRKQAGERRRLAERGRVTEGEKAVLLACAEEVEYFLKKREWKALVLTFRDTNTGLRLSPDLMRSLLLAKNDEEAIVAMKDYEKMARSRMNDARYNFKARVISTITKDIVVWGPEHVVPVIESEIEWKSGRKTGVEFLSIMYRYETDTALHGHGLNVGNIMLNPKPEYEPSTLVLKPDAKREGHMRTEYFLGRVHWMWFAVPAEQIERNGKGKLMLTATQDSMSVIQGHMVVPVTKDVEKSYTSATTSNPKLHGFEHILNEAREGSWLWINMNSARTWYKEGDSYKTPMQITMEKTDFHGDPFSRTLR